MKNILLKIFSLSLGQTDARVECPSRAFCSNYCRMQVIGTGAFAGRRPCTGICNGVTCICLYGNAC